ncbi:uncharacterized protein N7483_008155 [Penicillium malachiteum]|uniref:uncharacterized protein n=1 Tax=Penicillium malachiteum TaxID=1324776 RepID=UPI002547E445|nr:uncharacterized protein N7483_008155 [Penicillium malachiteum]KAJ5720221.1 hypothetical protein N7483_008155 [Penicillium malachiteum]
MRRKRGFWLKKPTPAMHARTPPYSLRTAAMKAISVQLPQSHLCWIIHYHGTWGNQTNPQSTLAELNRIEMAVADFYSSLQKDPTATRELIIFADSQAAIQAIQNPKRPSGLFILDSIYKKFKSILSLPDSNHNWTVSGSPSGLSRPDSFQCQKPSVTIRWVPAHVGILENELADLAAKDAAKATSELPSVGPGPRLAISARRLVRDRTGRPNHRLTDVPQKKNLQLFKGLSEPYTSILVQTQSQRIGLRHFLYKIKEVKSDQCRCDEDSQTPCHVLL